MERSEKATHQLVIESIMSRIEFSILVVFEFHMGIEFVSIFGGYLSMGQGFSDISLVPVTCTIDFVNLLVMRYICLNQNISSVTWIGEGFLHTFIVVHTKEYMSILSHLTSFDFK